MGRCRDPSPARSQLTVFADPPVLCGHRGSGQGIVGGQRENTLGSCRAAVEYGLGWIEVDARITADGVLVARHDPVADDGRFVADISSAETDELGLMRLGDLLEDLPPAVAVDVDVKTSLEDALRPRASTTAGLVADLVGRESARRRILVTSFDPAALLIVRERAPTVPLGLLTWIRFPLRKAIAAAVHLGTDVVAAHVESFPLSEASGATGEREIATSVAIAHEAGLQVAAWCPGPAEVDVLIEAGVDCLFVDDVPAAVRHRFRAVTAVRPASARGRRRHS
jgi:glycerophosphoryl diester phosphodiesterase